MAVQKPHSQADDRFDLNPLDQFGRLWLMAVEIETRHPTGLIEPAGWADPLRNTHAYLVMPKRPGAENVPDWQNIRVDLERWRREMETLEREWKVNLFTLGRQTYPANFRPETAETDEYLLSQVGPRPFPGTAALDEIIKRPQGETALALLGLKPMSAAARKLLRQVTVDDMEQATVAVVGEDFVGDLNNYPKFIGDAMRRGLSMSEAAALWRQHKAALEGAGVVAPKGAADPSDVTQAPARRKPGRRPKAATPVTPAEPVGV